MNLSADPALTLPALGVLLLVLGLLAAGVRRVPEGYALTIQRLGRYRRTLGPGWHIVLPGLDRVRSRVRLLGHHIEVHVPRADGADAAIYYQILEPTRTGSDIDDVDALVGREALMRLEALADDPGAGNLVALGSRLKEELNRRFERMGLLVIRCQLHQPGF